MRSKPVKIARQLSLLLHKKYNISLIPDNKDSLILELQNCGCDNSAYFNTIRKLTEPAFQTLCNRLKQHSDLKNLREKLTEDYKIRITKELLKYFEIVKINKLIVFSKTSMHISIKLYDQKFSFYHNGTIEDLILDLINQIHWLEDERDKNVINKRR